MDSKPVAVHTAVNRTTMVQSAKFFELMRRHAALQDLFNRVFHNFVNNSLRR
jgi:hypothetical protein